MNITNRDGQKLELTFIESIDDKGDSYAIKLADSWSMFVPKSECGDFVPCVGDWILVSYNGFNTIAGIIIEGRTIRAKTAAQCEADHEQWKKNYRLEKLERYLEHGDELKARVKALDPALRRRMERFAAKGGVDFWVDDAPYEMYALEGATAIVNRAIREHPTPHEWAEDDYFSEREEAELIAARLKWAEDWWNMNTKEGGYDYKGQMEILPEFGDGHSGNTAGAAYGMAKMILEGKGNEL